MTNRAGSPRRKSRNKLTNTRRTRGKLSLARYFAKFNEGDAVVLKAEPTVHKGLYHTRYHGKVGIIKGMQGSCYKVMIKDGSVRKVLIVHPVHLKMENKSK